MNLPAFFVHHPRFVAACVVTVAVWGTIALMTMPRQEDPAIAWRMANVVTRLPGESASRVESLITDVLEKAVKEVDEVEHVYSVSRAGVSLLQIELEDEVTDVAPVWQKVRHKLLSAAGHLPPGAIGPDLNDEVMGVYAVVAAISGENYSYRQLKDQAETLEDALRYLPRTASTDLFGTQQEVVEVRLDQAKLAAYNLSFQNVAAAIANRNSREPAGRMRVDADELLIEASGEFENDTELAQMVLLVTPDGRTLRLGDMGEIRRTTIQPAEPLARINGHRAVMVGARARADVRIDDYGAEVADVIAKFHDKLPQGMQIEVLHDLAKYIHQRSGDMASELTQCIVFVVLSTVVFIGWRTTAIISTALPLTALIVLVLFYMFGLPLNQMSVMALIMAMGMDVDCATMVTEQIHHRWSKEGGDIRSIAAEEARSLLLPLAVSTLMIVAAFLPIYLLPGGTGEFVRAIPIGVSICLLTALFVAVTIIPCICALVFRNRAHEAAHGEHSQSWFPRLAKARSAWFHRFTVGVTSHPILALLLVVGVMSAMTSVGLLLRRDFFSPVQRDQVIVDVYTPQGSALTHTVDVVAPVEQMLAKMPEVTSVGSFVGRNAPLVFYNLWVQETYANHFAQLIVNVKDWGLSADVARRVQQQLDQQASDAHFVVHVLEHGAPFVAPFEVRISGPSLETLEELGRRAAGVLATTPGVRNIRDNFGNEALQLVAEVNEPIARSIGIDQGTVANELRYRLDGLVASHIQEGDERIDINVRMARRERDDIADLNAVYFKPSADAPLIPFSSVATLKPTWKASSIYRRDGERTLSVLAYPDFGLTAAQVSKQFEPRLRSIAADLPPGYHLALGGESEQRHEAESNLRNKSVYVFFLIILLLVFEFHSLRLACMILTIVPLSMGGAMVALWLTGWPLNFMAIMGMTMLAGMLVTNAVIMVDGYERRREAGESMPQLVIEGTQERSLHVVVTTVNTITGFLPLAIASSPLWPPMAIAMIGGLTMSMPVCFVMVPAAYTLLRGGRAEIELPSPSGLSFTSSSGAMEEIWDAALETGSNEAIRAVHPPLGFEGNRCCLPGIPEGGIDRWAGPQRPPESRQNSTFHKTGGKLLTSGGDIDRLWRVALRHCDWSGRAKLVPIGGVCDETDTARGSCTIGDSSGCTFHSEHNPVLAGDDLLTTVRGTYFNPGPPIGQIDFIGVPSAGGDTVVRRLADANFPFYGVNQFPGAPTPGTDVTIPIELITLNLISVAPVNIGGSLYDVIVQENPGLVSAGTMTLRHEWADNPTIVPEGTFDSLLNVNAILSFSAVNPAPPVPPLLVTLVLSSSNNYWTHLGTGWGPILTISEASPNENHRVIYPVFPSILPPFPLAQPPVGQEWGIPLMPEPGTLGLTALGLIGMMGISRRSPAARG